MLINVYSMQKPCKDYFVVYNFYTYSIITHANTIKTILALQFFYVAELGYVVCRFTSINNLFNFIQVFSVFNSA